MGPEACLEDFTRHVSRFPDVVRYTPGPGDGEELPLGFTGPLQPLKRQPVIRSKQDEMSSEAGAEEIHCPCFSWGWVGRCWKNIVEDARVDGGCWGKRGLKCLILL